MAVGALSLYSNYFLIPASYNWLKQRKLQAKIFRLLSTNWYSISHQRFGYSLMPAKYRLTKNEFLSISISFVWLITRNLFPPILVGIASRVVVESGWSLCLECSDVALIPCRFAFLVKLLVKLGLLILQALFTFPSSHLNFLWAETSFMEIYTSAVDAYSHLFCPNISPTVLAFRSFLLLRKAFFGDVFKSQFFAIVVRDKLELFPAERATGLGWPPGQYTV